MASEKRLIDAKALTGIFAFLRKMWSGTEIMAVIDDAPTVDAVAVEDKELLKAIKILVEQYSHSKRSDYVHSPVAHALYHTWIKLDGERKDNG